MLGGPPLDTLRCQASSRVLSLKECSYLLVFCSAKATGWSREKMFLFFFVVVGWCVRFSFLNWFWCGFRTQDVGCPPLDTLKCQASSRVLSLKECSDLIVFCSAKATGWSREKKLLFFFVVVGCCVRFSFLNWFWCGFRAQDVGWPSP